MTRQSDDPPPKPPAASSSDGIERGRVRRTLPLVALSGCVAAEAVIAKTRGRRSGTARFELHESAAQRYAQALGRSKGALMKVGQMLSFVSANPIVPPSLRPVYETAFARLRDDAPPMEPELVGATLELELGRRAHGAFAEFDWEPLAAASIGQVHAARLTDGRAVAVKIQYPGVADAIRSDLKNVQLLSTFVGIAAGISPMRVKADVRSAAREIGAQLHDELDYRLEARNQMRFARRYRGHPFIRVPEVVPELSTGRVLTQELCVGAGWNEAVEASQAQRDRWAEVLWRFVYGSYLRFGLVNADPNPANFIFHEDGSVSFLDFGCVKRHSRAQVALRADVVRAAVRGDAPTVWRLCVEAGCWSASDPVSQAEALAYWREPFRYMWDEQPFTFTPEYATSWIECRASPIGPCANAIRHLTMPLDDLIWPRLEVGLASILADLRATNDWRAIHDEYIEGGEPADEMGRLDRAHFSSLGKR